MKRNPVVLSVLIAFIFTLVGGLRPSRALGTCTTLSGNYLSTNTPFTSPTFAVAAGDTVTATNIPAGTGIIGVGLEITINGTIFPQFGGGSSTSASGSVPVSANGTGSVFFLNVNNSPAPAVTMNWTITVGQNCGAGAPAKPLFTDGRLNDRDAMQTAAIYCKPNGGVEVWAVIDSVGYFAFTATPTDLSLVPEKPFRNTRIKSGRGVTLYRLTSGELQINAPNGYVYIWNGCPAS